jgi:hypothetical protein
MHSLRELSIRPNKAWIGDQLRRIIGSRIEIVEAALFQVVGTRPDKRCEVASAVGAHGHSCVTVEWNGVFICANRHWRGGDKDCVWLMEGKIYPTMPADDEDETDGFSCDDDGLRAHDKPDHPTFHDTVENVNVGNGEMQIHDTRLTENGVDMAN